LVDSRDLVERVCGVLVAHRYCFDSALEFDTFRRRYSRIHVEARGGVVPPTKPPIVNLVPVYSCISDSSSIDGAPVGTPRSATGGGSVESPASVRTLLGRRFGPPDMTAAAAIELHAVGTVRTPIESTDDAPRQGRLDELEGTLELDEAYADGLRGLAAGDDVDVFWFANEADRDVLRVTRRTDGEDVGVFATRAPVRPNPVMVTRCAVVAVDHDAGVVRLRGVDMLDGTPVVDLKAPMR
jgi:tRNA-Thr(GGU) m(6)t(6)A37 methyltransferase TsaA